MQCYLCSHTIFCERKGSVRDNESLKILECLGCGLVFLNSQEHIKVGHYENSEMFGSDKPSIELILKQTSLDDGRRFKFLSEFITNKSILDYGCGNAGFLNLAKTLAHSAEGVDLEARVRAYWADKLVIHEKLSDIEFEKFDLITSFHVLEHLKDPRKTLIEFKKYIKKNGRIVIEVPSSNDALLTLYGCEAFQEFTYWSQHLYLFSASNLEALARQAGLKVIAIQYIQRYPLSNHLFWLSKGRPGGHKTWNFLNSDNLSDSYENVLASLGLCDTLIAHLEP
jgi:2-polyprenyl-3-methyl-5-hydroxy-6-metoxy-1,4-benzoquinol methylase